MYMYTIYIHTYIRLPHPWCGDNRGQETFLAPSADNQTRNCDTDCSNHHPPYQH